MPEQRDLSERGTELLDITDKIFCERSGLRLPDHTEIMWRWGESKARRNSEQKIQEEARYVLNAPRWRIPESLTTKNLLGNGRTRCFRKRKTSGDSRHTRQENGRRMKREFQKREYRLGIKKSDNPDVLVWKGF